MIPARHRRFYVAFFDLYSRWMIRRNFREVKIISGSHDFQGPVLMIGNHFSWWDGFIACYINREIFHKKLHIMMLEEQLSSRMFLNKAGAFSIRKGSRNAVESLRYSADLLGYKGNLVVMYPQGEFESLHRYPVHFANGIERIARQAPEGFELVFYAALIDYFSFRKPTLTIYLERAETGDASSSSLLEDSYNRFLAACINQQKPCSD